MVVVVGGVVVVVAVVEEEGVPKNLQTNVALRVLKATFPSVLFTALFWNFKIIG